MLRWIDTLFPRRLLFQEDRRLLHLFVGRVLSSTGFAIVLPFLSLYLHGTRGVPMTAVGALFLIASLGGAIGQVIGGEWSDRSGRKVVLIASQVLRAVAFASLGFAVLTHAPFYVFVLATSLSAFGGRMYEPPSGAMVADMAGVDRQGEYYGVLRIAGNLGWALGPAIGGFLAALSYSSLFLVGSGVMIGSAAIMAFGVEETSPLHQRRRLRPEPAIAEIPDIGQAAAAPKFQLQESVKALRDPNFLRYLLISTMLFVVMAQLIVTLSVYAVEWAGLSKVQLGTLYALNGLTVVFLQFPAVKLTRTLRLTTSLTLGAVLYGLGYGMMGWGRGMAFLLGATFIVSIGEIIATPPSLQLVANFSGETTRGRYMGIFGVFNSIGWSLGPVVGGALLDSFHGRPIIVWSVIMALAFVAAAGYLDLRRRLPRSLDRDLETAPVKSAVA